MRAILFATLLFASALLVVSAVCLGYRFAGDQYSLAATREWWPSKQERQELRRELRAIMGALEKFDVPYMLHGQTLRDAVLFGEIPPWHRKATIAVFGNDSAVREAFEKSRVKCDYFVDHFRCGNVNIVELQSSKDDNRYLSPETYYRLFFGHGELSRRDIFPLRYVTFDGTKAPVPHDAPAILDALYGSSWDQEVCLISHGIRQSLMIPYGLCANIDKAKHLLQLQKRVEK